jgi:hypothetical protein
VTTDWDAVTASKTAFRQQLATLPIEEKLRMLDTLRERALLFREAGAKYLAARDAARGSAKVDDEVPAPG